MHRIVMMGLHVCVNIIIVLTAGFYNIYGSGEALPIPSSQNFRQVGYSVVDRILYGLANEKCQVPLFSYDTRKLLWQLSLNAPRFMVFVGATVGTALMCFTVSSP